MRQITFVLALLLAVNLSYSQKKTPAKKSLPKTTAVKKIAAKKPLPKKKPVSILVPYRDKNLWGFADTLGNIKVLPVYKKLVHFQYYDHGKANFIMKGDVGFVVVNQDQKIVMPELVSALYDSVSVHPYYPDHVHLHKGGKLGVYKNGKEIVAPLYQSIGSEPNESFIVNKGGLIGLYNNAGKMTIPIEYKSIDVSWDDITATKFVWRASNDREKKKFTDLRIHDVRSDEPVQIVEKRIGDDIVQGDAEVPVHIQSQYEKVTAEPGYGMYYVKRNGLTGVYDIKADKEIITPQYESVNLASVERNVKIFGVRKDGKLGLIKADNAILVPIEFDKIAPDRNLGGFILTKNGKKGLYVRNANYPYINPLYDDIVAKETIPVSYRRSFVLFKVKTAGGESYVGENGVAFFKD
jgi:hypothetical protein